MSDARLVSITKYELDPWVVGGEEAINDDPDGTHLLVPEVHVERISLEGGDGGWGIMLDEVKECPTCGGSGVYAADRDELGGDSVTCSYCSHCNGRGWVMTNET